jgi:hypothetical protein
MTTNRSFAIRNGAGSRGKTIGAFALVQALATLTLSAPAAAKPSAPAIFCKTYPSSPACAGGEASCNTCHTSVPARNPYGASIAQNLLPNLARPLSDEAFASGLPSALAAAAALDSDSDGVSNRDEVSAGSDPADPVSRPKTRVCDIQSAETGYSLCSYDMNYAFTKVMLDFCGRMATFEERQSFAKIRDQKAALHFSLQSCLQSAFWRSRDGVVWNMAAPKVKPIASLKAGPNQGAVTLADYDDDFALFTYANLDDHDVRDLLVADYYVDPPSPAAPTVYPQVRLSPLEDQARRPLPNSYQALEVQHRAGMLTTRWFRSINTMFSAIPRTTAAQAYRAYLGLDIALQQGLRSASSTEPFDYDSKGVRAAGCIDCHRTLDLLSYPFSRYDGLDNDPRMYIAAGNPPPQILLNYSPDRMRRFVLADGPRVLEVPEAGELFGKPVQNVVEWAKVAANSPEFAQKVVLDYWRLLFGADPNASDLPELNRLAAALANEDAYRVEKMLHRLIDTEAYGAP